MTRVFALRFEEAGLSPPEAARKQELFERAEAALVDRMGTPERDVLRWFVPGRIEIFGKHTDYAGGRSLVCALERGLCLAAVPRDDGILRVTDAVSGATAEIPLGPVSENRAADWSIYPRTVARRISRNFSGPLAGIEIAFASDLPRSAGLSSSSALIVGVFTALATRNRLDDSAAWRGAIRSCEDLAGYLGAVESGRDFGSLAGEAGVGTFGGSEDHAAILCCRVGHVSLYSFCPVRLESAIRLPADLAFVIGVSGIAAEKTGSAQSFYNRASLATVAILDLWRSATGRADATLADAVHGSAEAPERIREILRTSSHSSFTADKLLARFEQFLDESERIVPAAAEALALKDHAALGELAERSQAGAERGLRNQVPETVELVRSARALGAVAASAFGAGFGGSVWALVRSSDAPAFREDWEKSYRRKFPGAKTAECFVTGAGPALIRLS
ncbi:MAG: galactokinase [Acidobacteriota bacterium]|nr:galactokinase [Acidobacteriota bacterium]